ncbi:hypothetical protein BDY19DRAFT_105654 [Irpex rosettiformis]|uniref:Uncharacterized protein n=1 Tax=Irpex rosettiformis TaxID=378272 RepID=A0ACB8U595_9APHY|nr:hypothetical protein BDY19DRAFT_105654 [Irpex rosettiformis]
MNGSFIGPFKPEDFIRDLMPVPKAVEDDMPQGVKFVLPTRKSWGVPLESKLYDIFNQTIARSNISKNFRFFIPANGKSIFNDILYHPDGGFQDIRCPTIDELSEPAQHSYKTCGIKQNIVIEDPEEVNSLKTADLECRPFDWCRDDLSVEFKRTSAMDPFYTEKEIKAALDARKADNKHDEGPVSFEKPEKEHVVTRGQLALYVAQIFACQHRVHVFQLLICGRHARFFFWDHSGAIVSDSFDYTTNSALLTKFIWHYNHMGDLERGLDSTVSPANNEERLEFEEVATQFMDQMDNPGSLQLPHAKATLDKNFPVHKMIVSDDNTSDAPVEVLIQRALFAPRSAIGRGTRGYIAYPINRVPDEPRLKFLKDTWRIVHERLCPERQLLRKLHDDGVRFIPKVICGGDVVANGDYGKTRCRQWVSKQPLAVRYMTPREFQQHRLLENIAYPLESAQKSYQVVCALRDSFKALRVSSKYNVLHRDVSVGNIMMRIKPRKGNTGLLREMTAKVAKVAGVLTDWDHSGYEQSDSASDMPQKFRIGTWQFMSIAMLKNPGKAHTILDDFESVFWVLIYIAMHHFKHKNTGDVLIKIFDDYDEVLRSDGTVKLVGGKLKRDALSSIASDGLKFSTVPLRVLICRLANEWNRYYKLVNSVDELESAGWKSEAQTNPSVDGEENDDEDEDEDDDDDDDEDDDDDDDDDNDEDEDDDEAAEELSAETSLDAARKKLDIRRRRLLSPKFWIKLFKNALKQTGWGRDAVTKDPYPRISEKVATEQLYRAVQSSHMTGSQTATQDAEEQRRRVEEQRRIRYEKRQQLLQQLDNFREKEFDGDDASCICLEDLEERKDLEDEGIETSGVQNVLGHIGPSSSSFSSAPPSHLPEHPPAHSGMLPGYSTSSWRSATGKRRLSIDNTHGGDSNLESEGHASKKIKPLPALLSDQLQLGEGASTAHALDDLECTKFDDEMVKDDSEKAADEKEWKGKNREKLVKEPRDL